MISAEANFAPHTWLGKEKQEGMGVTIILLTLLWQKMEPGKGVLQWEILQVESVTPVDKKRPRHQSFPSPALKEQCKENQRC